MRRFCRAANYSTLVCLTLLVSTLIVGCGHRRGISLRAGQSNREQPSVGTLTEQQLSDIQVSVAQTMEQRGDLAGALAAWQRMEERDPGQILPVWRGAVIAARQGNSEQADAGFRRALQMDPKNAELHADYGYYLYLEQRWAEAESHLQQAVTAAPEDERLRNNLALLYARTERREDARREFGRTGSTEEEVHSSLAVVSAMSGDMESARREFQSAVTLNPGSAVAQEGLAVVSKVVAAGAVKSPAADLIRPAVFEDSATASFKRSGPAVGVSVSDVPDFDDPAAL
ncbi:MAG: tetratricopeptide repeat protein [Planctomycetaceae bacterium]